MDCQNLIMTGHIFREFLFIFKWKHLHIANHCPTLYFPYQHGSHIFTDKNCINSIKWLTSNKTLYYSHIGMFIGVWSSLFTNGVMVIIHIMTVIFTKNVAFFWQQLFLTVRNDSIVFWPENVILRGWFDNLSCLGWRCGLECCSCWDIPSHIII